ncbi:dnaJ homolog subfamily C member 14 isoform X1 [Danio rerio]|uniref:DnaJ homolog subfamily C member 14 isoform X1 n=3 Tax=Danio rerio TaxID=7955 RepID=A0AB32TX49_DANRE
MFRYLSKMEADMAVHWDTVEENTDRETPSVSLASSYLENDTHHGPFECEHEAMDDFDCEFPDEDFDLDENEEQNAKTEDLIDNQAEDEEKSDELRDEGETKSRNAGSGRKGKSKKSGLGTGFYDQTQSWTSSSSSSMPHKSFLASSRHKQVRRRNHHLHNHSRVRRKNGIPLVMVCRDFLSDFVSPWCISCIHMFVELIISLTHRCGLLVESSGIALYDFGTQMLSKVTDIPGLTQDMRRIVDWSRCWTVALIDGIVRSTCKARNSLLSTLGFVRVALSAGSQMMKCVVGRLAGERGRKWWLAFQSSRIWRKVSDLCVRIRGWRFKRGAGSENSNPESPNRGAEKWQPGEELQRLLALAKIPEEELDPFNVLGVDVHATESELKRAYRQLAVQVHPDKNKHPGAGEAFKVLRAAWDIVSNPETRREYELKRMAATELSKSMNEFLTKLQDDLKEAMNTMMCTKCEGALRWTESPARLDSVLNVINGTVPRRETCGPSPACWDCALHSSHSWTEKSLTSLSGQAVSGSASLQTHTECRITSPSALKVAVGPAATDHPQITQQAGVLQQTCRISSTASSRLALPVTRLQTEDSSLQETLLITAPDPPLELLPCFQDLLLSRAFSAPGLSVAMLANTGLKEQNLHAAARKCANRSSAEMRRKTHRCSGVCVFAHERTTPGDRLLIQCWCFSSFLMMKPQHGDSQRSEQRSAG